MTKIETIIAEIERLKKWEPTNITQEQIRKLVQRARLGVLIGLEDFITSLPAEQPSEDLEEAAIIYANKQGLELKPFAIKFFKSGAQWQKQQMMKNCLYNTEVMLRTKQNNKEYLTLANDKLPHIPVSCWLNVGDKVSVIIVKEDEQ